MNVHIDTENPKAIALIEYLKSLDFVSLESTYEIPESHKLEAMEAKAEYIQDPSKGKSFDQVVKSIKNR